MPNTGLPASLSNSLTRASICWTGTQFVTFSLVQPARSESTRQRRTRRGASPHLRLRLSGPIRAREFRPIVTPLATEIPQTAPKISKKSNNFSWHGACYLLLVRLGERLGRQNLESLLTIQRSNGAPMAAIGASRTWRRVPTALTEVLSRPG